MSESTVRLQERPNNEKIIMSARHGDQEAMCELYNTTRNYAWYMAKRYLHNDSDVEDVLQEVYCSAFSKLNTFEDGMPFKPWLLRIVRNKCIDSIRKNKNVFISDDEIGELATENEDVIPVEWLERTEKQRDIVKIIDTLPHGQRTSITLFYLDNLPISEISQVMGVTQGTVKYNLHHGRKKIKEQVLQEEKLGNKLYSFVPIPALGPLFTLEAEMAVMSKVAAEAVWAGTVNTLAAGGSLAVASSAGAAASSAAGTAASSAVGTAASSAGAGAAASSAAGTAASSAVGTAASSAGAAAATSAGATVSAGVAAASVGTAVKVGIVAKFIALSTGMKALTIATAVAVTGTVVGVPVYLMTSANIPPAYIATNAASKDLHEGSTDFTNENGDIESGSALNEGNTDQDVAVEQFTEDSYETPNQNPNSQDTSDTGTLDAMPSGTAASDTDASGASASDTATSGDTAFGDSASDTVPSETTASDAFTSNIEQSDNETINESAPDPEINDIYIPGSTVLQPVANPTTAPATPITTSPTSTTPITTTPTTTVSTATMLDTTTPTLVTPISTAPATPVSNTTIPTTPTTTTTLSTTSIPTTTLPTTTAPTTGAPTTTLPTTTAPTTTLPTTTAPTTTPPTTSTPTTTPPTTTAPTTTLPTTTAPTTTPPTTTAPIISGNSYYVSDYYNSDGTFSALGLALQNVGSERVLTLYSGDTIVVGSQQYTVTSGSIILSFYTQPSIDSVNTWWNSYLDNLAVDNKVKKE